MIETQNQDNRWRCRFSATLENIDVVDDLFTGYIRGLRADMDIFGLRILAREAMLNAVIHGCRNNPDKTIGVLVETDNCGVTFTISDPGCGFKWTDHQRPSSDLCESGRGLALMRIYSDNITFNEAGNIVSLRKNFKVAQFVPR
jgi:serine/threonine-protein kinase RsbW